MGSFENHQYQSALLGIISAIMSANKSDGKLDLGNDTRSHQECRPIVRREPEHGEEHTNVSEDSSQ
jgi:hypothetical protein